MYISGLIKKRLEKLVQDYESLDRYRELIIRLSREILNNSVNANRLLSKGDLNNAKKYLENAFMEYHNSTEIINRVTKCYERKYLYRIMDESVKELVEATLFYNRLSDDLIGDDLLKIVPNKVFINGLFDYSGELRRKFLETLLNKDIVEAKKILEDLNEIYDLLNSLILKSFYIPDFRKRLDMLKSSLLKSMEDLSAAIYSRGGVESE